MKLQIIIQTIDEKNGQSEIFRNYDETFFEQLDVVVGQEIKEMVERILPNKKDEPLEF